MTTTDPLGRIGTNITPQNKPVPGRPEQVKNNAGGYVFKIDPLAQLRRFLTIGSAGGSYYVGEDKMTQECVDLVLALTKTDTLHQQMVDEIVKISLEGRAKKQNPTLFALAVACQHGSTPAKRYARKQITKVVRTGTHLFLFVGYLQQFGGWSRGLRKAVAEWYTEKGVHDLSYQLIKYRQREGWTHRDVLRLTHPKFDIKKLEDRLLLLEQAETELSVKDEAAQELSIMKAKRNTVAWTLGKETDGRLPNPIVGFEKVQSASVEEIPSILKTYTVLPWEALPDAAMNDPKVWDQLLDNGVPIGALLRQLPRLTQLGLIHPMGGVWTQDVFDILTNPEAVRKARIHPIQVLVALATYEQGHGMRSVWTPVAKILDALDEMFYISFQNVPDTGLRTMDCLDVSGSMANYKAGNTPLTAREVSAALAMVSVRTQSNQMTMAFRGDGGSWYNTGNDYLKMLPLSSRQRLADVIRTVSSLSFGRTDCALPMVHAMKNEWEIDTFVIYTDNETWYGAIHPFQALKQYRKVSGIDSRLVVVSLTPSEFSIADPSDPGMLDISGFDSSVPNIITDFSLGLI